MFESEANEFTVRPAPASRTLEHNTVTAPEKSGAAASLGAVKELNLFTQPTTTESQNTGSQLALFAYHTPVEKESGPEEWRECPDFSTHEVSSHGRFRSKKTGRISGGTVSQLGYINVGFKLNGKQYVKLAHRLVARAFLPQPNGATYVNHLNRNRTDNRACNLQWCTPSENVRHWVADRNNQDLCAR